MLNVCKNEDVRFLTLRNWAVEVFVFLDGDGALGGRGTVGTGPNFKE